MAFTFFFRDAQTLELLVEQALPALCGQAFIRIWDAGCAHGPEPYTLAMLLRERMNGLFEMVASYAQIYRRLEAAESVRLHVDGPHVPLTCVLKDSRSMRKS